MSREVWFVRTKYGLGRWAGRKLYHWKGLALMLALPGWFGLWISLQFLVKGHLLLEALVGLAGLVGAAGIHALTQHLLEIHSAPYRTPGVSRAGPLEFDKNADGADQRR